MGKMEGRGGRVKGDREVNRKRVNMEMGRKR